MFTVSPQIEMYGLHETSSLLELVAREQTERFVIQLPHGGVIVCLFPMMKDLNIDLQWFFALRGSFALLQTMAKLSACGKRLAQNRATSKYFEGFEA